MSKRTRKSEIMVVRLEPQLLEYIEKISDSRLKKSTVVRNMVYEFYLCIPPDVAKQIILGYKLLRV